MKDRKRLVLLTKTLCDLIDKQAVAFIKHDDYMHEQYRLDILSTIDFIEETFFNKETIYDQAKMIFD